MVPLSVARRDTCFDIEAVAPEMGRMWLGQRTPGWDDCDKLSPTFQSWLR